MLEAWVDMNRLDCDRLIRHVFFSIHVSRSTTLVGTAALGLQKV